MKITSQKAARFMWKNMTSRTVFLAMSPGYISPEAGFFLWLPVEDDETAALKLWRETGVRVLPGGYLAQNVNGVNPGKTYIRVAMVAPKDETTRGIEAIRACLYPE